MSNGSYIDDVLWKAVIPDLSFNPDAAIYKFWRELRNDPSTVNPGLPVTPEIETEVGIQQGFSGGVVLGWNETDGAYIANG
jgi:uncharacterized protein with LGFP repeats